MADIKNHASLPTSLVSYWDLEEASGIRYDLHSTNDLNDYNSVLQGAGKTYGNGADFELSNSEMLYETMNNVTASLQDLNGDMSMSMWFKAESLSTTATLAGVWQGSSSDKFLIWLKTNAVNFRVTDGVGPVVNKDISWTASTATWYHFVLTYDASAGSFEIFVDSVSQGTNNGLLTSMQSSSASNHSFNIGARTTAASEPFDGIIDEAGIWSKVLTQSEIDDLYNSGSGLIYSEATLHALTVGGGGGGGGNHGGGGGGAGRFVENTALAFTPDKEYTITVGAGGAGGVEGTSVGVNGTDSSLGTIQVAEGGGYGGGAPSDSTNINGNDGGSGGGGNGWANTRATGGSAIAGDSNGGSTPTGTGNDGGLGGGGSATYGSGGGGGGATGTGTSATAAGGSGSNGGAGGAGTASSISGSSVTYAGGGGGGSYNGTAGAGGTGGGGDGGDGTDKGGHAGTANTGGGGGGAGADGGGGGRNGGAGGSGVVIVSFVTADFTVTTKTNGTETTDGSNTVITWETTGALELAAAAGGGATDNALAWSNF